MSLSTSFKALLGVSVSSLVLISGAQAQEQPIELDTIVIEGPGGTSVFANGQAATGPVDGYVATQSASGTKTTTPLIETPQSISVITRQQLEDRGVQNLGQALGYTAGVVAAPFGNDVRYFAPIIRGFEAVDSVYLNSFRFIRDFGALSFEPYGQERIDVIKGPASVLYGQGEPGGLINLVAKRPTFEKFLEAGAEVGTNNRYQLKFDGGNVYNDVLSYRLTALGRLADGEQDFTGDDRFYIAPSMTWAPDEDTSLTVLGSLQYDTGTSQIGLPKVGTLYANPNGVIPNNRYLGEPGFNDNKSLLGTLGYEFKHRFNDTFEFRQNAQYQHFDADAQALYLGFVELQPDQRTANRGVGVQSEVTNSVGIDNQLEAKFETGVLEHTTVVGLDYRHHDQWRSSNFSGIVGGIDVFNPQYGSLVTVPGAPSIKDLTLQQLGLYVQDQIKIERLHLNIGLRHDWAKTDGTYNGGQVGRKDSAFSGQVGVLYKFDNGIAPFVSYSTSFNPQVNVQTASTQLLEPSEGRQYEAGIKFQPEGWNAMVQASVFEVTKTNMPVSRLDENNDRVTTQIGEARSRGFEFETTANLAEGWDILGSYTYADTRITVGDVGTTGNRLKNIPDHSASLWLGYTFQPDAVLAGVKVGGGVRYVGERYGNDSNVDKIPANTVFDASVAFEKENLKATLAVQNIADERYVASCNFGCFYGEGRTVVGSLSYKW